MQKSMAKLTGQIGQFVVIKQENFSLPSPTYTKVFPKQNNQHKKMTTVQSMQKTVNSTKGLQSLAHFQCRLSVSRDDQCAAGLFDTNYLRNPPGKSIN